MNVSGIDNTEVKSSRAFRNWKIEQNIIYNATKEIKKRND